MKSKLIEFFLLYILVPLIIIPFICNKTGEWYGMFGSVFYYVGIIIAKFKQWIFFPIPLSFTFWYWYTYGISIKNFVSVYFFCLVAGIVIYRLKMEYDKYMHRFIPEKMENQDYQSKLDRMNLMIEKYKQDHPGEKVTLEIMDKIKSDVFF